MKQMVHLTLRKIDGEHSETFVNCSGMKYCTISTIAFLRLRIRLIVYLNNLLKCSRPAMLSENGMFALFIEVSTLFGSRLGGYRKKKRI